MTGQLAVSNAVKSPPALKAQTHNQKGYLKKLRQRRHDILFAVGPAGTGKTYMAVREAIAQFQKGEISKIIITRPNVATGDDLGYLPGTMFEKMAPWVRPIIDVFMEHYAAHEVQRMIQAEEIEIAPLAYMRGRTFKNATIIADEMQNSTIDQMKMLMTRIGDNARMIITGDIEQWDRQVGNTSGLADITRRLQARDEGDEPMLPGFINNSASNGPENMRTIPEDPRAGHPQQRANRWSRIGIVRFERCDVVRHPVIEEVLELYDGE